MMVYFFMTANHHLPTRYNPPFSPIQVLHDPGAPVSGRDTLRAIPTVLHHATPPLARNRICGPLQFEFMMLLRQLLRGIQFGFPPIPSTSSFSVPAPARDTIRVPLQLELVIMPA